MKGDILNVPSFINQSNRNKFQYFLCLIAVIGIVTCLIMLVLLQFMTTYSTDDYYYASFCQDGFRGFIEKNVAHYQGRNGRVIVLIAAELILASGLGVFSFVTTILLLILLIGFIYFQAGVKPLKTSNILIAACVFFVCLLLPGYPVLKSGLLCVADVCNYILPLALIAAAFGIFSKVMLYKVGFARKLTVAVLFLLAGATTEQGSVMTVVILLLYLYKAVLQRSKFTGLLTFYIICALTGLATIILSPATQTRIADEFTIISLMKGLQSVACSFAAPRRMLPIMVFFCLCVWILAFCKKCLPRVLLLALPVGGILAFGFILPQSIFLNTINFMLFSLFILTAALCLILRTEYEQSGFLLLAGLCSTMMVIVTDSGSVRTCIPFMLCLSIVSAFFVQETVTVTLKHKSVGLKILHIAVLLPLICITIIRTVPTLIGVGDNYVILSKNKQAVEEARITGVFRYKDYDPYYCLCEMFNGNVFESVFRNKYQLYDAKVEYHTTLYESNELPLPAILRNDTPYYHLRSVIDATGGTFRWIANEYMFFTYDGKAYLYDAPYLYCITEDKRIDARYDFYVYNNITYISGNLLKPPMPY